MRTIGCRLCGTSAPVIFRQYPGYQEPHTFDIAQCRNCRTGIVVQPEGLNAGPTYAAIYRGGAQIPGYDRYFRYADAVIGESDPLAFLAAQELPYRGVVDQIRRLGKGASILEVGCGLGYLTYALNRAGYDVTGLDIDPGVVETARRRYGPWYKCERIEAHTGSYDLLVLTEVLEHVPDPLAFLRACQRCLKPGGSITLSVPNRDSLSVSAIWDTELPPVHLWWFSRDSFRWIARTLEMSVEFIPLTGDWRVEEVPHDPWTVRARALPRLDIEGQPKGAMVARRSLWRGVLRRAHSLLWPKREVAYPIRDDVQRPDFATPSLVVALRPASIQKTSSARAVFTRHLSVAPE